MVNEKSSGAGRVMTTNGGEALAGVVDALCAANGCVVRPKPAGAWHQVLPSRDTIAQVVEALRSAFFPGYFGATELTDDSVRFHVGAKLSWVFQQLCVQVQRGLCFACGDDVSRCPDCDEYRATSLTQQFIARLPEVQRLLATDVRAAYEGDPAATSPDEAIFCYPGLLATISYRLAHELSALGVPLLPRMITEQAHSATGIDIHPGATIGEAFFIDHGTGVVIGETCVIGNHVSLYQGVTLGAKSFPLDENGNPIKGIARHPIVEDDVIIYGGATILGRITIGRGSMIGGNVWLTHSVPPGSKITQAKTRYEDFREGSGI